MAKSKFTPEQIKEAVDFIASSVLKGRIPNGAYPQAEQRYGIGYQTLRIYVKSAHPELVGRVRKPKSAPTVEQTSLEV